MVNKSSHVTTRRAKQTPKLRSRAVGQHGENVAAQYLQDQGYVLIDRNWRGVQGEVDLIALDGSTLVVCEVKARTSADFGGARVAVTAQKLDRLRRLLDEWRSDHQIAVDAVRIDVIAISVQRRGAAHLEHMVGVS